MNKLKKTLVFTATYNEAENIEKLINSIKKQPFNLDILIVDDNSPDGTKDIIISLQKNFRNLFLIKRQSKLGLDSAHKIAYNYAKSNQYDFLITMDADLSHDPDEIKNFLINLESYAFVIGSRYIEGGKCLMKKKRLLLSKFGNLLMKYLLRIKCNEFTTSYRGFNIKKLHNFNLDIVKTKGYSFFMGTIYEIAKRKYIIKEIPIIFKDRIKGYSKIPRLEIFRTLKNLFILSIRNLII
jgi:glycosyltransferase involved in cell wall biosynthesis